MRLHLEGVSACGPVRPENQDVLLVGSVGLRDDEIVTAMDARPAVPILLAVADGMGGVRDGGYASASVCSRLGSAIQALPADLPFDALRAEITALIAAEHSRLLGEADADVSRRGMGTTLTGIVVTAEAAVMVHVGDSRLYRWRESLLTRLSRDHTLRELRGDPSVPAHLLTNSVGGGPDLEVDVLDLTGRLLPGDIYLLCSDGLTGQVGDQELESMLGEPQAARGLVELAIARGGADNITLLTITVKVSA
jgi:PPM family protein phosphatase